MKEKEAAVKNKLIEGAKEINGVKVIKAVLPMPADAVKNIAFQLKGQFTENLFVVIGSVFENKPLLTVTMSEDQVKAGPVSYTHLDVYKRQITNYSPKLFYTVCEKKNFIRKSSNISRRPCP